MSFDYWQVLRCAAPEAILAMTALVVLFLDLGTLRSLENRYRRLLGAAVTSVGCLGALFWTVFGPGYDALAGGILVVDGLTQFGRQVVIFLTLLTVAISADSDFTDHVGEFFCLILLAAIGMMLMVGAENLLMIYVALELTSLSLVVLVAFQKRNPRSAEAALKYFLFGSVAAAFALYGFSLLYGLAGTIELRPLSSALADLAMDPLVIVAVLLVIVGFGFKVAAVPFHLWAPDTYQAAPIPSAALIASGSKVAGFILLAKVMVLGLAGLEGSGAWRALVPGWAAAIAILAAFSMVLGNLVAIVQSSVKRLLAYSAIAHAGYLLLGVIANNEMGLSGLVYYVATYAIATVGAFGFLNLAQNEEGDVTLEDLNGFWRRAPFASLCMMIFVLSLAGIPPLAGFLSKFYVFAAVLDGSPQGMGNLWLVILAVSTSAVSLYYYLQVLKRIYVADAPEGAGPVNVSPVTPVALGAAALGVIVLGCVPRLILDPITRALAGLGL